MKILRQFLFLLLSSSLIFAQPTAPVESQPWLVVARVHWPEHDLSNAQLRVFRDVRRQDLVGSFPALDAEGRFVLPLEEGEYYLMAVVDVDGDANLGPGDGLGFYGVIDPANDQPQPLKVSPETAAVTLVVSLMMDAERKLVVTGVKAPEAPKPQRYVNIEGQLNAGETVTQTCVFFVPSGGGPCYAVQPQSAEGCFTIQVLEGPYWVFAVQDLNADEFVGPGDLMAVSGYDPEQGETFPVTEFREDHAALTLSLQWTIAEDGLLHALKSEATGPRVALETLPAVILGHVTNMPQGATEDENPPAPLPGIARAFGDAALREESALSRFAGERFVLCVPTGIHFVTVTADCDASASVSPGDLLGFYGVKELARSHGPQPLMLRPGELRPLELILTTRLNNELRPEALTTP